MTNEAIEKAFIPFTRHDDLSSLPTHETSNRIGLSICKQICEQFQGEIKVISTLNMGSTFNFTMKVIEVQSQNRQRTMKRVNKNLLIIEENDEEENQSVDSQDSQESRYEMDKECDR